MDRLRCLQVFVEVARAGSFAEAARRLGMSRGAVTKHVSFLEEVLGTRLLNRTTRNLGLTEAGSAALEQGQTALGAYESLETELRGVSGKPRGIIRVGSPPGFAAMLLVPLIAQFTTRYPEIQICIIVTAGEFKLIESGLDVSFRVEPDLADASYVALPLRESDQVLVASPAYLRSRPAPARLEDLVRHNCLVNSVTAPTGIWRFTKDGESATIRVKGSLFSNFSETLRQAALLGVGMSIHMRYSVDQDLRAGRLVEVLPEYKPDVRSIHLVYADRHNLPDRVRKLINFVQAWSRKPSALGPHDA